MMETASSRMSPGKPVWPAPAMTWAWPSAITTTMDSRTFSLPGCAANRSINNNGDGTFTNVTAKAGLDRCNDPKYGPLWSNAAVWVDVNSDGLLDLFVVNYLQWDLKTEHLCGPSTGHDYCSPKFYEGQPNQLFLNRGDGTLKTPPKSGAFGNWWQGHGSGNGGLRS